MIDKETSYGKTIIFGIGILIFLGAAALGWIKLQYGFNFIDEGYHMTESWRLAAGDDFLKDKMTGAAVLYTLINKLVFQIDPNITLLEFRKLQYILTILSLMIFGFAIFTISKQYIYLPYIFSLFAFTGLDPIGMISNLYYQTYPHLFLTLYLSFLFFGLHVTKPIIKKIFYVSSGLCLWGISLTALHLSVIILSPIIMLFFFRKFNLKSYPFSFTDTLCVLSPFMVLWLVFITIYNKPYIMNLIYTLKVAFSMPSHSSGLVGITWDAIKYISISSGYLAVFFILIKKKIPILFQMAGCAIAALLIFFIIKTSCFGLLPPYNNGILGKPMWFSSLLIAFTIFFWFYMLTKYFFKKEFEQRDELSIILMIPFAICSLTMSSFSTLGLLSVSQSAIPAVAALAILLMHAPIINFRKADYCKNAIVLILLLSPFYYTSARFDWIFTYYDVPPWEETVRIEKGFGKGIYTNKLYYGLYEWLNTNAEQYTQIDDYAISYIVSPMVHMIIKKRPSLDDTFITFEKSNNYYKQAIEKMEKNGRNPKIAFVFERMPILSYLSADLEKPAYTWPPKYFDFSTSQDPISSYIKTNMVEVSEFKISDNHIIRCFIDNGKVKEYIDRSSE